MNIIINNRIIKIENCNSFKKRLFGFMFIKDNLDYGLYFSNCNSIHTFFCFQNLDIIMTDKDNRILYIYKDIKPNKIIIKKGVKNIYEFSSNYFKEINSLSKNDIINIEKNIR